MQSRLKNKSKMVYRVTECLKNHWASTRKQVTLFHHKHNIPTSLLYSGAEVYSIYQLLSAKPNKKILKSNLEYQERAKLHGKFK